MENLRTFVRQGENIKATRIFSVIRVYSVCKSKHIIKGIGKQAFYIQKHKLRSLK